MKTVRTKGEVTACYMLRQAFSRSFLYWDTLRRVKQGSDQYKCEGCGKVFKLREMAVDHTEPVVDPSKGWEGVTSFAARLFCSPDNLKALCRDSCHSKKTRKETKQRTAQRRAK